MADEPVCICGHVKSRHMGLSCQQVACPCPGYRRCVPWPDSEGLWWISGETSDDDGNNVPAKFLAPCLVHALMNRLLVVYDGKGYMREDWEEVHSPARFVKLIEQNPFES